jgi:hypothetical protein
MEEDWCSVVHGASCVCSSQLRHLRAKQVIDDPPKDRWDNITFPLDI